METYTSNGIRWYVKARDLVVGAVILERSPRGTVVRTMKIAGIGPCKTDPGNMHVSPEGVSTVQCYAKDAEVEVQSSEQRLYEQHGRYVYRNRVRLHGRTNLLGDREHE